MDILALTSFLLGIGLLIIGAELLVRGAARLAAAMGVSPLVIGLTVVAYGTGSPELAIGVQSAWLGQGDIILGNVIGSNIFNVLFILGISALIAPLAVSQQLVRLDVPLMIGVSFLLLFLALDGQIGLLDGGILLAGAVAYTVFAIQQSRRESREIKDEYAHEFGLEQAKTGRWVVLQIIFIILGLALLTLGSRWLVAGAVAMARILGVSELIIGLTLIAAGTSLPEIATSIIASLRNERDIAVGNIVGSNLFNILAVLGLAGIVAPASMSVPAAVLSFDIPVMIAVALACLPIFFIGNRIARWEGGLFLGYYIAYMLYLILDTTRHEALPAFSTVMMAFVIPLTVVTLLILVVRTARQSPRHRTPHF
jgi:cation:H+ antiporter